LTSHLADSGLLAKLTVLCRPTKPPARSDDEAKIDSELLAVCFCLLARSEALRDLRLAVDEAGLGDISVLPS